MAYISHYSHAHDAAAGSRLISAMVADEVARTQSRSCGRESKDAITTDHSNLKMYTWANNNITPGLPLTVGPDNRHVAWFGKAGPGGQLERVTLDKYRAAEVVSGVVFEAGIGSFSQIVAGRTAICYSLTQEEPSRDSNPPGVLVHIQTNNTNSTSLEGDSAGYFVPLAGEPVTLVQGSGVNNAQDPCAWSDALVILTEGEAVRIHPMRAINGSKDIALWMERGQLMTAPLSEYTRRQERLQKRMKVSEMMARSEGLNFVAKNLHCVTLLEYPKGWKFQSGIEVTADLGGMVVALGYRHRQEICKEIPVGGLVSEHNLLACSVAELWTKKGRAFYGLVAECEVADTGDYLVRVHPTKGVFQTFSGFRHEILSGTPLLVGFGKFIPMNGPSDGGVQDAIYAMRPGDAIKTSPHRVITNDGGRLRVLHLNEWERAHPKPLDPDTLKKQLAAFGGKLIPKLRRRQS